MPLESLDKLVKRVDRQIGRLRCDPHKKNNLKMRLYCLKKMYDLDKEELVGKIDKLVKEIGTISIEKS